MVVVREGFPDLEVEKDRWAKVHSTCKGTKPQNKAGYEGP